MKGLKKIALATAVAAAPFAAHAELKAMNDTAMGDVTGQAGVTIELETKVNIGEFVYTDEGSFAVKDITIGGEGVGGGDATKDTLDNLALEIDVQADGDATIHVTTTDTVSIQVPDGNGGTVAANAPVPIDFGVSTGNMELRSADGSQSTVLLSNLSLNGDLAALDIRVDTAGDNNVSGVANSLGITAKFDIDNLDVDVPFMAVGIRGMVITGSDGDPSAVNDGVGSTDYATVSFDVYKGTAQGAAQIDPNTHLVTGMDNQGGEALVIDIADVDMDVYIDQVNIGGGTTNAAGSYDAGSAPDRNIGSVALDNLHITNTKLTIYGH